MKREELTETQQKILKAIEKKIGDGTNPIYSEIAKAAGFSVKAVQHQLDRLEEFGVIRRKRHESGHVIPRTISIV